MIRVVVGGHARKVGKTLVAAGLIAAFKQFPWTAVKITSHQHANADASDAAASGAFAIHEETDRMGHSDTSRFLAAGAARALWVRTREDGYDAAVQQLLPALQSDPFVIFESNRILRFLCPDLFILVLRYDVDDFKESALKTLHRADAIVAINYQPALPAWKGFEIPTRIPLFKTTEPQTIPSGLIGFMQSRLPVLGLPVQAE
jgi:hypothetical protein